MLGKIKVSSRKVTTGSEEGEETPGEDDDDDDDDDDDGDNKEDNGDQSDDKKKDNDSEEKNEIDETKKENPTDPNPGDTPIMQNERNFTLISSNLGIVARSRNSSRRFDSLSATDQTMVLHDLWPSVGWSAFLGKMYPAVLRSYASLGIRTIIWDQKVIIFFNRMHFVSQYLFACRGPCFLSEKKKLGLDIHA